MKKCLLLGAAALLFASPALAACGEKNETAEEPRLSAPMPEISDPNPKISAPIPEISDPIPPFSEEPAPQETEPEPEPAAARYIVVCADGLNVRSGAGVSFPVLGQAERGALLAYKGTEGGWHRTLYRGKTAYVSASELYTALGALPAGDARTEAVIGEGMRLLGTPYVYGATRFLGGDGTRLKGFSEEKFDCSSLMQYIFYRGAGVTLDVTTRTQIAQGTHVDGADLRRGDLLFFTNATRFNRTGIERVGHVALYLGDNYILHTASDYAKVEQLSAARKSYFLEARRVL